MGFVFILSTFQVQFRDSHLVTILPVDVLASNEARTRAGTVLAGELDMFLVKFLWLSKVL